MYNQTEAPAKPGAGRESVEKILSYLRPRLQMDGGDVEFVGITPDNVVKLRLTGACRGCPMSTMTLKMTLESEIKQAMPEIKSVEAIY